MATPPGWNYERYPTPAGVPPGLWGEVAARDRHGGPLRRLGIAYARTDYNSPGLGVRRAAYVPHWLVAGSLFVAPAGWLARATRRRRARAAGLCRRCGYDLRASPGRCPECGAAAASPAAPPG